MLLVMLDEPSFVGVASILQLACQLRAPLQACIDQGDSVKDAASKASKQSLQSIVVLHGELLGKDLGSVASAITGIDLAKMTEFRALAAEFVGWARDEQIGAAKNELKEALGELEVSSESKKPWAEGLLPSSSLDEVVKKAEGTIMKLDAQRLVKALEGCRKASSAMVVVVCGCACRWGGEGAQAHPYSHTHD